MFSADIPNLNYLFGRSGDASAIFAQFYYAVVVFLADAAELASQFLVGIVESGDPLNHILGGLVDFLEVGVVLVFLPGQLHYLQERHDGLLAGQQNALAVGFLPQKPAKKFSASDISIIPSLPSVPSTDGSFFVRRTETSPFKELMNYERLVQFLAQFAHKYQ